MVNRIAEHCEKQNMTIEQLSSKSNIPMKELTNIVNSNNNIEKVSAIKVARIAESLKCHIEDLIYED